MRHSSASEVTAVAQEPIDRPFGLVRREDLGTGPAGTVRNLFADLLDATELWTVNKAIAMPTKSTAMMRQAFAFKSGLRSALNRP
jgi:hypothetical protein